MKRIKPEDMEKNKAFAHMSGEMQLFALKHKQVIRGSYYLTIEQIGAYMEMYSSPTK